ncbi:MAG TPA: lipoate--protein ligase family protein [Bryobacteraceae bacterium]|nr:lipoate--protein ligase family protein [Bryobacteraceae bacterium]
MLRLLDHRPLCAEENLAFDSALFQAVEGGADDETLRLWESAEYAVVVGRSGVISSEVEEETCAADGVAVLRRDSGGGAVLLGPGCMSFSLLLPLGKHPQLRNVRLSYRRILTSLVRALAVPGLEMRDDSDLAIGGRKVSGNAQFRGRRGLLHHGTLLYQFNALRVERYLRPPARQPEYRAERSHLNFLGNLPLSRDQVRARLARLPEFLAWE